ncbi:MAG: thiamine pyrophosphate-dependent enzyme, partial [Candidatus Hydrogenedens sp.]
MTKRILISPEEMRKKGEIKVKSIPVNQYQRDLKQELEANEGITPEVVIRIYRDMVIIREFETMLDKIKKLGSYEGIEYQHAGPAHLSIGQEGSSVGECVFLRVYDHIFGSHRSHGEIIAKGLRAIRDLMGNHLIEIMKSYWEGKILQIVENHEPDRSPLIIKGEKNKVLLKTTEEEELGIDFLLYGLLSEIFGREYGFNKGMGGSMHAFFTPFGVYPANAIVGGSADIATGSALYRKARKLQGITIANIGDASVACGPVWEAMMFSVMGQYKNLWDDEHKGGLPIIFNFM